MAFESIIWRLFGKKRFGTFLACLFIPTIGVFLATLKEESARSLTMTQRIGFAGLGAAVGVLAFVVLTAHDWLRQAISIRRSQQGSVRTLERLQLVLYIFVVPFLLFTFLLVVVIYFF